MSRIIHVSYGDHNDLAALDRWIAILLDRQKAVGQSLEFYTGQLKRYMNEYHLTTLPALAEMGKYGGLRQVTLRMKDANALLEKIETQLVLAGKKKDRILGRYPEDKY